jgi:hypothetical protein
VTCPFPLFSPAHPKEYFLAKTLKEQLMARLKILVSNPKGKLLAIIHLWIKE